MVYITLRWEILSKFKKNEGKERVLVLCAFNYEFSYMHRDATTPELLPGAFNTNRKEMA